MSEPIFFPRAVRTSLADIVACTGATVAEGADLLSIIRGAAPLEEAEPGDLTFFESSTNALILEASCASACFVTPQLAPYVPQGTLALVVEEPCRGFALALQRMFPHDIRPGSLFGTVGINPGASIHPEARLEQGVIVDPGVVIGPRAEIGSGSVIGANSVIGSDVRIGRESSIGPQVTITHALIGNRVTLHTGVRIGQYDTVEFAGRDIAPHGLPKAPQIGRVIIQDDVEIGANSTIDRGTAGDTVVGEGSRVDNLVRIAHNVMIGRHCIIPAQAVLSGGARLRDFTILTSKAGIS
jgi:UDP-3-O-[3-hydroxymyristoyl] glucosamine N-acyltransferase